MSNISVLTNVKSLFSVLTKKEKIVGQYLLDNFMEVSYMNINELSNKLSIGETTILRFCKKIGFSGYHEFRNKLASEIKGEKKSLKEGCISNTYNQIVEMMDDTLNLSDYKEINRAASMIKNSDTVFLFGIGFSGLSAVGAQIRLNSMGHKAFSNPDNYIQILTANLASNKDIVVGFSISGETKATIDILKLAKKNGSKTICITNNRMSSITKVSDVVVITAGKAIGKEGSTLITEMSQLFVLEQIFNRLREIDKDRITGMNIKVHKSINEGQC
ncbi:MurR/RpiR family transcriptional regulator [Clostridium sp. NSJ-6]|uniref:MurR/RpiR family transcriptional regulator n=1 Tax=Clostridium hominis TaxID=2763036 RepID=A0ABR7DAI9_9CLOT|nr:MurR/RpiR family transcriptional regulator [Clostridium hominis]MDU2673083.1 MurR/RpiR family transcriptional regulator [Clostridium sp.]